MNTYYGGTEEEGEIALAAGAVGGSLGGLAAGAAGTAEALNGSSTWLSNLATTSATSTAVSTPSGMGINAIHKYVDESGNENDGLKNESEEKSYGEKAWGATKTLGGGIMGGIGGLLGGLGGAVYGTGKKAYNKATGGEDVSIMDNMIGGAKMVDNNFGGYAGEATKQTVAATNEKMKIDEKNTVGKKLSERKDRVKNIIFGEKKE